MTTEKFAEVLGCVGAYCDFLASELTNIVSKIDGKVYDRHGADIDDLIYSLTRIRGDVNVLISDMRLNNFID